MGPRMAKVLTEAETASISETVARIESADRTLSATTSLSIKALSARSGLSSELLRKLHKVRQ